MTVLIGLFIAIAAVSGLVARQVVPGARDRPLVHAVLIGAAVTAALAVGCWFIATPVARVLASPLTIPVPLVVALAAVALSRSRRAPTRAR